MKKPLFTFVFFVYAIIGIFGFLSLGSHIYVEQDSWTKVLRSHFWWILLSAIITGMVLFNLYKRWMPEQYEKRKDRTGFKVYAPLLYIVVGLFVNAGMFLESDLLFPGQGFLVLHGVIMNKDVRVGSKKRKTYFVSISDTITKLNYYFEVKEVVYRHYGINDSVNKTFLISKLGVVYRNEE